MKKVITVLLCAIFFNSYSADFRNANWGMTKSEVIQSEKEIELMKDPQNPDMLMGSASVNGYRTLIYYYFINNKLWNCFYVPQSSESKYASMCFSFLKIYEKKYGKAKNEKSFIVNSGDLSYYLKNPGDMDKGLISGEVNFTNWWETKNTKILMLGKSEIKNKFENEFIFSIFYATKNKELLNEVEKSKAKEINNKI